MFFKYNNQYNTTTNIFHETKEPIVEKIKEGRKDFTIKKDKSTEIRQKTENTSERGTETGSTVQWISGRV